MSISQGQYNADWQEFTIDELMHVQNGYAFKSGDFIGDEVGTYEVLKMGHIERGGGLRKSPKKDFIHRSEILQKWVLQKNDIVMAMTDMKDNVVILGVPALIDKDDHYALNQRVARLTLKDEKVADIKFIYNYLKWEEFLFDLQSKASSGVQVNLSTATIKESVLKIPPLREQRFIAGALSSLDDKIDLLHRQNKTLEAMAETLFRHWFVDGVGEDCLITDLVEFNPTRKLLKGTVAPYLEMAALSTTTFNSAGWFDREFSSGMKFINGDTLLARITPCLENGKTAYVTFLAENQVGWGSTEFIVMRPVEALHPLFAYALARNQVFREYAEGCMVGSSGRQRVDIQHLKLFAICKPTKEAISTFNDMARSVEPKLHANMIQIKTLEKLRDSLLPKLMSGEVRVA